VQGTLPFVGASRGDIRLMALGQHGGADAGVAVILAFGALTAGLCHVGLLGRQRRRQLALRPSRCSTRSRRVGNHEGSMLLWALILALFGAAVAVFGSNLPDSLRARVLACRR
jgi:cytochrome c-type biogenesis protein CcmF